MGIAIGYFAEKLITVSIPLTDSQDYDLVVEIDNKLCKVQVKTTRYLEGSSYCVHLKTCGGNRSGSIIKNFNGANVDYLFVYCFNGDKYLIPTDENTPVSKMLLGSKYVKYKVN